MPVDPKPGELREQVRSVYSEVAAAPSARHPFRVGRGLAERAGFPEEWLARVPAASLDAFAGVWCLPCFAEVPVGARVLDLGCGAGLDSLLLASRAESILGLDFSEQMLARARSSAEVLGISNVDFRKGDAEAIPAEDGAFDLAIVNGIFNLNPSRSAIFSELARVVRQGGAVYAAELVLKGPLPAERQLNAADWFS